MVVIYYIWLKAFDETGYEYEFYDEVDTTHESLEDVLKYWHSRSDVTVTSVSA